MIFVDTGGWFSALVPDDALHEAAATFMRKNDEPLVTTDYVLDELLTLLKIRGHFKRSEVIAEQILGETVARLE